VINKSSFLNFYLYTIPPKNQYELGGRKDLLKKENMGKLEPRKLVFRIFLLDKDSGQGI